VALVLLVALVATGMSVSSALGLFTNSVGSPTLVAKRTPTATVTAVATTAPTATATVAPTTTPIYVYVQPTAAPPKPLSISPTTVALNGKFTCQTSSSSPIMISNLDSSVVTWKWTSSQPALSGMSFQWDLNNTGWHSGLPFDSKGIAAYDGTTAHTDSLALKASCNSFQSASPITVTMTDSQGRSYTLKLTK